MTTGAAELRNSKSRSRARAPRPVSACRKRCAGRCPPRDARVAAASGRFATAQ